MLSFVIGICYAKLVWHRIPYAAANLNTALTAVKANMGLVTLAYAFMALALVWTMLWMLGLANSLSTSNLVVVFILFLSYYWVHQVLQNTGTVLQMSFLFALYSSYTPYYASAAVHVTTVGVIGTWWFVPDEASSHCSPALADSFFRSVTYSFGSICFGSFLVAFVQALRALEYYSRDNDDLQFLNCIIQCLLACIQAIVEEFTKWAVS
jgi:hypothetical protein